MWGCEKCSHMLVSLVHIWQNNAQQLSTVPFKQVSCQHLYCSHRTTPLITIDVLIKLLFKAACYSMKRTSLQMLQSLQGVALCLVILCTPLNEHRKTGLKKLPHIITHKLDPGGFGVEPADQLTNIWTCLCFISQPPSLVETMTQMALLWSLFHKKAACHDSSSIHIFILFYLVWSRLRIGVKNWTYNSNKRCI